MNAGQFLIIFTLVGGPSLAANVTLTPAHLGGKWIKGGKQG